MHEMKRPIEYRIKVDTNCGTLNNIINAMDSSPKIFYFVRYEDTQDLRFYSLLGFLYHFVFMKIVPCIVNYIDRYTPPFSIDWI